MTPAVILCALGAQAFDFFGMGVRKQPEMGLNDFVKFVRSVRFADPGAAWLRQQELEMIFVVRSAVCA